MWIIDLLVTHPSPHPESSSRPSNPGMLRTKEYTPTPYSSVIFTFGLIVKSIKEFKGASITMKARLLDDFASKETNTKKVWPWLH
jgi:hypothetical protein